MQLCTFSQLAEAVRHSDDCPVRVSHETIDTIVRLTVQRLTLAALGTGVAIALNPETKSALVVSIKPLSEVKP